MNSIIKITILLICLCLLSNCQVGRDIVMDFLKLDRDNDYLLSPQEINELFPTHSKSQLTHANLPIFKSSIYPLNFWKEFDTDSDTKISIEQLKKIINDKWTIYSGQWPEGHTSLLQVLNTTQYMDLCDLNKDVVLQSSQFPACLHAVLTLQQLRYPHKIKSMFYASPDIGYELEEFKKLLPKFGEKTQVVEKYIKNMFNNFEWDNKKIATDNDQMIGPQEGKIMEPLVIMMYLDKSHDGELSKQEALFMLKKYGGESAFKIADKNADNKLDRYQFMSYYNFASCIDCKGAQAQHQLKQQHKSEETIKQQNKDVKTVKQQEKNTQPKDKKVEQL